MADVFCPEFPAHHDAIMCVQWHDGEFHVATMQFKLHENNLNISDCLEAVWTTNPHAAYTTKKRRVDARYQQKRTEYLEVLEKTMNGGLGCLRVIFIYPTPMTEKLPRKYRDFLTL